MLPIKEQKARKHPTLFKGLNKLKYGSRYVPAKSVNKRSTEPIVNKIPPVAGLMLLKEGQYTNDPAT